MFMRIVSALFAVTLLAACGERAGESQPATTASPATAASADMPAGLPRQPSPEGAELYFISPQDGDVVSNPVTVIFGLTGAGVAPAGVVHPATGHHHLLVDVDLPPLDLPIPDDGNHYRHFGMGQTEAVVNLEPGERRLQLVLGDHLHIPHDPPLMSEPITIRVE